MHTTTRQRGALSVVLGLALLGGACGDGGPRATRLPAGADSPVIDASTTVAATPSPSTDAGAATAPAKTTPAGSTVVNTTDADRDMTQIEADLRRLDEDLSNSQTTTEGAVE